MQHQFGQPVARRTRKRSRGVESSADLRSVDAEQADAPDRRDVDGVAVDDRANEQGVRTAYRRGCGRQVPVRDRHCCQHQAGGDEQEFHRDLL
jgi:hypothetical protein